MDKHAARQVAFHSPHLRSELKSLVFAVVWATSTSNKLSVGCLRRNPRDRAHARG